MRSIFEYGCVAFLHVPDSVLETLQKIQNKALRIVLHLPKYVSIKILHESACLLTVKERMLQLGSKLIEKMRWNNPLIKNILQEKEAENLSTLRQQGTSISNQPHRSPLDILLPDQQTFLHSS